MSTLSHKTDEILILILDELDDVFEAEYINLLFDGIINLSTFSSMIYSDEPHDINLIKRSTNIFVISQIKKYLKTNSTKERLAGLTKAVSYNSLLRNAVNDYLVSENLGVPIEQFFIHSSPFIFGTKN